jgi:drug/metabolite transporter (DMT)-like permease
MPLWSGLIAFLAFGERPGGLFVAALAMGMAGVGLLSFRGGGFAASDLPGMGFMFAAAIGWALGVQHGKRARHRPDLPMLSSTGWQLVLASVPLFLIWPIAEPLRWPEASAAAWLCAAYVTFVALIVGYISWFTLVKILPSHVASLSTLAVPATAMASGALALGEPLGPREALALLLMLGALALVLVVPALLRGRATAQD